MSVYVDTILICTASAMIILVTDNFNVVDAAGDFIVNHTPSEYGALWAQDAINQGIGTWGGKLLAIMIALFVFTSLMGYYYQAESNMRLPSRRTIGKALHVSENTVRKCVYQLGEKERVTVEPTTVITRDGQRRNSSSRYTIRPFRNALAAYHRQTLDQLEPETVRQRAEAALTKHTAHRRRCEPPCAPQ